MCQVPNGGMTELVPETPSLTIGAVRLEHRVWGAPSEGPTGILLLHEGLGSVSLWRKFPELLAQRTGLGIAAFSRQGYGRSDPCPLPRPLDYMEREAIEVMPRVLDALDIEHVILLGHSDGASIAALCAGREPDSRIGGVILIAPHFFVETCSLEAIAAARVAFETSDLRARLARHHDDPDGAFKGWCDAWLDPGFRNWNIGDCLDGIAVPVLAIQGTNDPYGTEAQVLEVGRRLGPSARVEMIQDCGHAPHLEAPEPTLDIITNFVADLNDHPIGHR